MQFFRPAIFIFGKNVVRHNQKRALSLQEHCGMHLLSKEGIRVPPYGVAKSADEAYEQAKRIGGKDYVVKAQVLAGGRGKGKFDSGLEGGVQIVFTPEEARQKAKLMIGSHLVTKQTTAEGRLCEEVLICKRLFTRREYYFSMTLDRNTNGPILIGSSKGGVNIEEVAATDPKAIITLPVDINTGVTPEIAAQLATKMGFADSCKDQAATIIQKLYNLFVKSDCSLLEINPMAEDVDGNVYCMDCKLVLDPNAEFRQKELFSLKDTRQEDELEVRAEKANLNYIRLDGNIGCMVNGAGLAMATMDIIKLFGGKPANFLDVGGTVTEEQVFQAFRILTMDPSVKAILVNIFAGIVNCATIAKGLIKGLELIELKVPLIVRLEGTNVDEARRLLKNSGLKILTAHHLDEAAKMAVEAAKKQAHSADDHYAHGEDNKKLKKQQSLGS